MVVLVGMGEHMAEQFLPLYLLALGGGFISIGFLNAMDNLLGALYSFPGGYLSDRLGTKRALLVFNVASMVGFLIVVLVPTWQAFWAGAALFLSWTAISLPATMGLVAKVLPKNKRAMGVSLHSLVRRVPMALGPVVGGAFIKAWGVERGVRLAFIVALVMAVIAAVLQQFLIEDDAPREKTEAEHNPVPHVALCERRSEAVAGRRHPGAVLRADSVCVRRGVGRGDGERAGAGERVAVRRAADGRNGDGDSRLYPGGIPGRSQPQETVCGDDVHFLYVVFRSCCCTREPLGCLSSRLCFAG